MISLEDKTIVLLKNSKQGRRLGSESIRPSPKLRKLKEKAGTEDSGIETSCISDAGLSVLGESFTQLEKLSLIWCNNVSSGGMVSTAQKCRSLKCLDLQVRLTVNFTAQNQPYLLIFGYFIAFCLAHVCD